MWPCQGLSPAPSSDHPRGTQDPLPHPVPPELWALPKPDEVQNPVLGTVGDVRGISALRQVRAALYPLPQRPIPREEAGSLLGVARGVRRGWSLSSASQPSVCQPVCLLPAEVAPDKEVHALHVSVHTFSA